MRKPKWHARVFYVVLALAFAIGLAPLAAIPVAGAPDGPGGGTPSADFSADATVIKPGQRVCFYAETDNIKGSKYYYWDFEPGGGWEVTNSTSWPYCWTYGTEPNRYYTVKLKVCDKKGNEYVTVEKEDYIKVLDAGLIVEPESWPYAPTGIDSQIGWNVLTSLAYFEVPDDYGSVSYWDVDPSNDYLFYSDSYRAVVRSNEVGECLISGVFSPTESLDAVKKWGTIDDTELETMTYDSKTGNWTYDACPGESEVTWYEGEHTFDLLDGIALGQNNKQYKVEKQQVGMGWIRERVIGTFEDVYGEPIEHPANGALVYMYLLDADAPVDGLPQSEDEAISTTELLGKLDAIQADYPAWCVGFLDGDVLEENENHQAIKVTKVSQGIDIDGDGAIHDPDEMGLTGNILIAEGEEAVKIVMVATYPGEQGIDMPVFAEICGWNFWTQQMELVPQVHWVGEKVVLEKQFGSIYRGDPVLFNVPEGSYGTLFPVDLEEEDGGPRSDGGGGGTAVGPMGAQQVWTECDEDGVARAILESSDPNESHVICSVYREQKGGKPFTAGALYDPDGRGPLKLINQANFVVYFIDFFDVTLGNVVGNRTDHNAGLFMPENPWKDTGENETTGLVGPVDPVTGELNVSQDALLRARVRGYFWGVRKSGRPATRIDSDHDGVINIHDVMLDPGYWVLPDDWPYLAGHNPNNDSDTQWMSLRPHWDIMDMPYDEIMSEVDTNLDHAEELGDYVAWNSTNNDLDIPGKLIAEARVIGPYSTLDTYTADLNHELLDGRKTIVRNGKLNWWDCPMPPAKIIFEITQGPGFFKDADKGDIYYEWVNLTNDTEGPEGIAYTNPYYAEMIPASSLIPALNTDSGVDWRSWDHDKNGQPYPFWQIFNQLDTQAITPADPQHPTYVEVYSDNHGEAMVWLNGDSNLDLSSYQKTLDPPYNAFDVPTGEMVGTSTVLAKADYPYARPYPALASNTVTKNWTWGKELKGYSEYVNGDTSDKRVLVFVCNRDGFPAIGERIVWTVDGGNGGFILSYLVGTNGTDLTGYAVPTGESWTRLPTPEEAAAFEAKFGTACHHAVAGIVVRNTNGGVDDLTIKFYEREGVILRDVWLDYNDGGGDVFWQGAGDPAVQLYAGWTNVAWADQTAPAVADAVAPLGDAFVAIWHYNGATKEWLAYKAGAPDYANDNFQLKYFDAYWVQVTGDIIWNQGS